MDLFYLLSIMLKDIFLLKAVFGLTVYLIILRTMDRKKKRTHEKRFNLKTLFGHG